MRNAIDTTVPEGKTTSWTRAVGQPTIPERGRPLGSCQTVSAGSGSKGAMLALVALILLGCHLDAQVTPFGTGFAPPGGSVPTISVSGPVGTPAQGEPFSLDLTGPPGSSGLLVGGLSNSSWLGVPLPIDLSSAQCGFGTASLLVSADVILPLTLDGAGSLSLPLVGWTFGLALYVQIVFIDPATGCVSFSSAGICIAPADPCARPEAVWGISPVDNSVWKLAPGGGWFMPNPAARLKQISVGDGEVWGISSVTSGPSKDTIWRWNPVGTGGSWNQPQPAARARIISAGRGQLVGTSEVWAISPVNNSVWRWTASGNSGYFTEPNPGFVAYDISVGSYDNIWCIGPGGLVYRRVGGQWVLPGGGSYLASTLAATKCGFHSAFKLGDQSYASSPTTIYKWYAASYFGIPNVSAAATQISCTTVDRAWAIGANYRVFQTTNGGASWTEPNPLAGLKQISVGYE